MTGSFEHNYSFLVSVTSFWGKGVYGFDMARTSRAMVCVFLCEGISGNAFMGTVSGGVGG